MAPDLLRLDNFESDYEGVKLTYTTNLATPIIYSPYTCITTETKLNENVSIERYIINENATIIFWDDKTKTISKRHKEDKFDKELGFLFAYFYKKYKGSNASRKRVLECIDYKEIKTFLFEFYVNDSDKTIKEARNYLKNLTVDSK